MAKLVKLKVTSDTKSAFFLGNEKSYEGNLAGVLGVALATEAEIGLPVTKVGTLMNSSLASRVVVTASTNDTNARKYNYSLVCATDKLSTALAKGTNGLIGKQIDGRTIRTARQPTRRIFVD